MKTNLLVFLFTICFYCAFGQGASQYNGTPYNSSPNFFPIGVWLQPPYDITKYHSMGVNVYVGLDWGALDASQLSQLKSGKMYVMTEQDSFALTKKADSTIFGWLLGDEPDNAQWNSVTSTYDSCINPSVIMSQYNAYKIVDPSRPVYLNLGQGVANLTYVGRGPCYNWIASYPIADNGYLKACDIGSFDIYPVNSTYTGITGSLWYVAKGMDSLVSWSQNSKPLWTWIETTKIDNSSAGGPTPAQTKSEVWMAVIHGAHGIGYFCDSWIPSFTADAVLNDTAMVSMITSVNTQIASLAPVINSPNTSGYASVSSSNSSVPVDFMTKNYGSANYIFSVAMRSGTTTATFTVASGTLVTVLGENRTINIVGGKFSDVFSAYSVHLYKITSSVNVASQDEPAAFRVYPNPSLNGSFTLSFAKSTSCIVTVYSSDGRKVYEEKVNGSSNEIVLNNLPRGIYFINISDGENNFVRKLVVLH